MTEMNLADPELVALQQIYDEAKLVLCEATERQKEYDPMFMERNECAIGALRLMHAATRSYYNAVAPFKPNVYELRFYPFDSVGFYLLEENANAGKQKHREGDRLPGTNVNSADSVDYKTKLRCAVSEYMEREFEKAHPLHC